MTLDAINVIIGVTTIVGSILGSYYGVKISNARLEERHNALSERTARLEIDNGKHFEVEGDLKLSVARLEAARHSNQRG